VLDRGTVYRTDDGGETWEAVGRAPDISDVIYATSAAVGPDGRLYVGLTEIGVDGEGWVYRTAEVVVAAEPEPELGDALGVAVSPNPFLNAATVMLTLSEPAKVTAALYDVLGRRVAVLASGPFPAGRNALPLEGRALPPGVYVVRVTAGEAVAARPLTLIR
jgi:hypothetical protein